MTQNRGIFSRPALPLLYKELVELSQHRATYLFRTLYAAGLFAGFSIFIYFGLLSKVTSRSELFGVGRSMFAFLVGAQLIGVVLFLPAMMTPAITREKEQRSLPLLILSDLRPWEILLQKYLGRLIPMFSCLMLSMPLLAITYAYGGISLLRLILGTMLIVSTCLLIGAMSLMFSAFCQRTTTALVIAYVVVLVLMAPWWGCLSIMPAVALSTDELMPAIFIGVISNGFSLLMTLVFLVMARVFLIDRAMASPSERMEKIYRRVRRANQAGRHGRVEQIVAGMSIQWRELLPAWLKWHYLLPIAGLIALAGVLFVALVVGIGGSARGAMAGLRVVSLFLFIFWIGYALVIAVMASNLIAGELANQTMLPLLASPLTGREMLKQKMAALNRILWAGRLPLVIWMLVSLLLMLPGIDSNRIGILAGYLIGMILLPWFVPMLIVWWALWIGLRSRNSGRAVMMTVGSLVLLTVIPVVVGTLIQLIVPGVLGSLVVSINSFSPLGLIVETQFLDQLVEINGYDQWLIVTWPGRLVLIMILSLVLRWWVLKNADRYLGRV